MPGRKSIAAACALIGVTVAQAADASALAIYVGNNPADLTTTERWFGRRVDAVTLFVGSESWQDWHGSLGWIADRYRRSGAQPLWALPLIPKGASLEAAAAGTYDAHYTQQAREFVRVSPGNGQIYIRLGWEFNGTNWNAWSAVGKSEAYVGAYRRAVERFRVVSKRFVFEWTPNIGDVGMDPTLAYPGDAYVDVIGMNFYYKKSWFSWGVEGDWQYFVDQKWGLRWHQEFAATHCKPTAYAEWGVDSDSAAPFVAHARAWFDSHNVLYQGYWNSNAAFPGKLSDNALPRAAAAYRRAFGAPAPRQTVRVIPRVCRR